MIRAEISRRPGQERFTSNPGELKLARRIRLASVAAFWKVARTYDGRWLMLRPGKISQLSISLVTNTAHVRRPQKSIPIRYPIIIKYIDRDLLFSSVIHRKAALHSEYLPLLLEWVPCDGEMLTHV